MSMGMYGLRGMGGMAMLGMNMGMNPMSMVASMGGLGASYFDPRAAAMTSMATSMGMGMMGGAFGGVQDPSQGEVYQTVGEACGNLAKASSDGT
jgi:hypothetical protein